MAGELSALVSLHDNGQIRRGDVVVIKVSDAEWGTKEVMDHQVVLWPPNTGGAAQQTAAAEILNELNARLVASELDPKIVFPFSERIEEALENGAGVTTKIGGKDVTRVSMSNRSTVVVNLDNLSGSRKTDVLDPTVHAAPLAVNEYGSTITPDGLDTREPSRRGTKAGRDNAGDAQLDKDKIIKRKPA